MSNHENSCNTRFLHACAGFKQFDPMKCDSFFYPTSPCPIAIWLVKRASVLIHCGEIGSRNGLKRHGKEDLRLTLHTKRWVQCHCEGVTHAHVMCRLRTTLPNVHSNSHIQLKLSRSRVLVKVLSSD